MKKLLFTCLGGLSSSLLASKYQKYLEEKGLSVDFEGFIGDDFLLNYQLPDTDCHIGYIHASGINVKTIDKIKENYDLILLAPQARYLIKSIEELLVEHNYPKDYVQTIPSLIYGRLDAGKLDDFIHDVQID